MDMQRREVPCSRGFPFLETLPPPRQALAGASPPGADRVLPAAGSARPRRTHLPFSVGRRRAGAWEPTALLQTKASFIHTIKMLIKL